MPRSPPPRPIPSGRNTNSNDFSSMRRRVFVGNLSTDKTSKGEIEEMFAKFGEIESCSLHKNFGFIQFLDEKGADEAVKEMHGKTILGKRIDVNLAGLRRKTQTKDTYDRPPDKKEVVPDDMRKFSEQSRRPRDRSRSPIRSRRSSLSPMSRYEQYRNGPGYYDRPYSRDGYSDNDAYRRPPVDPYRQPAPYSYRPRVPSRPAIDCEVVALSKEDSRYAEDVESRLRSIGLMCNIGYPPPELSTIEVVDRIARCGTLYAIVVSSQNVTHQSCTLNVLFGARQEHRNMPLTDAVSFVARNFDTYLRDLREPAPPASSYFSPPSYNYHAPQPRREYDTVGSYPDPYSSRSHSSSAAGYRGGYSQPPTAAASRQPSVYSVSRVDDRRDEERGRSSEPYEGARNFSSEVLSSMIAKLKRDTTETESNSGKNEDSRYPP